MRIILNVHSEFSLKGLGTRKPAARWLRTHNFKGTAMTKFSYLLAAGVAIAMATPAFAFAQDAPKAGVTINQGSAPAGEVKRDEGRSQEGREMRKEGDRDHGRMEVRGERHDRDRGEMRGERREMRSVEGGDHDRGERHWRRAHAEHIVIIHHRHRHHHHDM
jgi:hypothetical protein